MATDRVVTYETRYGPATITLSAATEPEQPDTTPLMCQLEAWRREWRRVMRADMPRAFRRECERLASRMADWEA